MKYRNSIIALGFLVVIIQFLGFSESIRNGLFIISGIAIIALAYLAGKR
ncbi:MAG: hypothetical protein AAB484_01310 [Patescibacteria group bacterium]